jgi:WD40-like Beta Propeller Repeat
VINLTNTPEIREEGPRWSPDGKTVAPESQTQGRDRVQHCPDGLGNAQGDAAHSRTYAEPPVAIGCLEPRWKTLYANRLEVSFTDADIYAIDILSRNATNLT